METTSAMPAETRRNFVFAILSNAPPPTATGTITGWLEYYKLQADGEVYVSLELEGISPEEGDVLWFQIDDRIIARVTITRAFLDPMRNIYELWYWGPSVQRIDDLRTVDRGSGPVNSEASWLKSIPPAPLSGVS